MNLHWLYCGWLLPHIWTIEHARSVAQGFIEEVFYERCKRCGEYGKRLT